MIYKGRLISAKPISSQSDGDGNSTAGIKFKIQIEKNGQPIEVFSDSWMSNGKTLNQDGSTNLAATNMTRKRLKLIGLDMDVCTMEEWVAFSTNETLFAGAEIDVLEKTEIFNGAMQFKYEVVINQQAVTPDFAAAMFDALKSKGKTQARPSMGAPQPPKTPRPIQTTLPETPPKQPTSSII